MAKYLKNEKGFTLIELLVVVAIITLLASIVFASLTSARNKAEDASIKSELNQLATLANLNYNDYGTYCQMQPHWINSSMSCSQWASWVKGGGYVLSTYEPQAATICANIANNLSNPAGTNIMFFDTQAQTCNLTYSFMSSLNDGNWYCVGSSGSKGEYSGMTGAGCYITP